MPVVDHVEGDLFASGAAVLVNPVNCVGASGKGLALEFARRFPEMDRSYRAACRRGEVAPGKLHLWSGRHFGIPAVLCFPTKRHWREPSRVEDVEAGLLAMRDLFSGGGARGRVALPRLGCGLGGLSWLAVRPLVEQHLGPLPTPFTVYVPT